MSAKTGNLRAGIVAVLVLLATIAGRPGAALGAAFWGPAVPAGHTFHNPGTDPVVGGTNDTFRWSAYTADPGPNPIPPPLAPPLELKVQISDSFMSAFGTAGEDKLNLAFGNWELQTGGAFVNTTRNTDKPNPVAGGKIDFESAALHEIGHALGLDHPDQAALVNRNFTVAGPAYPYVGVTGAADPNAVMRSNLAAGVTRRDLTTDDWAGINFLYDPQTKTAPVAPEPTVLDPNNNPIPIDGAQMFDFQIGVDPHVGPPQAFPGTNLGKNIDIFAFDFTLAPPPGFPSPPADDGEQTGDTGEEEGSKQAATLAFTVIRFSHLGGNGPGIIDGTPDIGNPDGLFVAGCDIYFNTNVNWFVVPEPASGQLLLLAGSTIAAWGVFRRRRSPRV